MRFIALTLLALAFAGCSEESQAAEPEVTGDGHQGLEATDDTGIIRGVVVDATITPVEGVTITIISTGEATQTAADGTFGFGDLEPAAYFLSAEKLGFESLQLSVDVAAGVMDPEILKVQMVADPSSQPYVEYNQFEGFVQCSFNLVAVSFNACGLVSALTEVDMGETQVRYDVNVNQTPMWAQTEMSWESTQPAGDNLALLYSYGDCGGGFYCDREVEGGSTLVMTVDEATLLEILDQENDQIYIRVFGTEASALEGTNAGLTLEQPFSQFTSVFYNFVPVEGWMFTESGSHPIPN